MGSRVYLNLKLLDKRREREAEGIPLTSPMNSQGSGGYVESRNRDSTYYAPSAVTHATRPDEKPANLAGGGQFGYTSWSPNARAQRFVTIEPMEGSPKAGYPHHGED